MTTALAGKRIQMTKSVTNGVFSPPAKGSATAEPERQKSNQHLRRNPPIAGEAEAIAAAQAGDGAAFERLYSLHKRLAVNVVLMHLRKKGLPQVSLEETLEPSQEDGPRKDIGARDLMLSGSIDRVTLERAVSDLPPGYRLVFVLHDVEGYEHNEIADMLECSIGNSKSQLHKARMKLRDLLRTGQPNARREALL
jgi:RNA polymerase sigma-70 factor (ECF subfamily)